MGPCHIHWIEKGFQTRRGNCIKEFLISLNRVDRCDDVRMYRYVRLKFLCVGHKFLDRADASFPRLLRPHRGDSSTPLRKGFWHLFNPDPTDEHRTGDAVCPYDVGMAQLTAGALQLQSGTHLDLPSQILLDAH